MAPATLAQDAVYLCHWYAGAGLPVAVTLKLAVDPREDVAGWGWEVIVGAVGGMMVKVAVMAREELMANEHIFPLGVGQPVQEEKAEPASWAAVRVTEVPEA